MELRQRLPPLHQPQDVLAGSGEFETLFIKFAGLFGLVARLAQRPQRQVGPDQAGQHLVVGVGLGQVVRRRGEVAAMQLDQAEDALLLLVELLVARLRRQLEGVVPAPQPQREVGRRQQAVEVVADRNDVAAK